MNMRKHFAVVIALAGFSAPLAAQTEIKFGHVGEPGSLFAASAEEFAKRANAKLGGKAKVVVYEPARRRP
jgi:TRAP-type C4-dicarboxylate transport system substrate-binding protein